MVDWNTAAYKFTFKNHFDDNGALFFLGIYGRTRSDQVDPRAWLAKTSSTSERTTSHTHSSVLTSVRVEPPTCYSIRNKNMQSHTMLNWQFEGSADGINW